MMSKAYADIYATPGPFTQLPGEGLPDIKRFITTHDSQGEGVFLPADMATSGPDGERLGLPKYHLHHPW